MLEVSNIDVCYGDLQALWDVSFKVREKEIVALLGANGAGKTTILKTVAGLLRPLRGSITFNDVSLHREPAYKIVELGVCLVPEGKRLFAGMSVLENLEIGAYTERARKVKDETLKLVYEVFPRLKDRRNQLAGTLSGGEQQLLAMARALMSKPSLLLLDEPTMGVAPLLVGTIFDVVTEINRLGVAVVLVEQNVPMALNLASYAYIIENGRVFGHGSAKDLLHDDKVRDAYLGMT